MHTFFPLGREVVIEGGTSNIASTLPSIALTMNEVEQAIRYANPWKALDIDDLPAITWQKLWTGMKDFIYHIFNCSLITGREPRAFKITKIIHLSKPNKSDYQQRGRTVPYLCC